MIRSFRDRATEQVWRGERSRRLPPDVQQTARRKLRYLDAARRLKDLAVATRMMSRSSTTTDPADPADPAEPSERLPNPHPGEVLLEDFLKPMGLSQNRLARDIGVPPRRINEIVLAKRAITADTDLRLARYFGISEGIWLSLQAAYDLEKRRLELGDRLEREIKRHAA